MVSADFGGRTDQQTEWKLTTFLPFLAPFSPVGTGSRPAPTRDGDCESCAGKASEAAVHVLWWMFGSTPPAAMVTLLSSLESYRGLAGGSKCAALRGSQSSDAYLLVVADRELDVARVDAGGG